MAGCGRSSDSGVDDLIKVSVPNKADNVTKLLFYNVQGLRGKVELLESFLDANSHHILCFNEHWLNSDEIDVLNIKHFLLASSFCRAIHIRGGVGVYVRSDLRYCSLPFDTNGLSEEIEFEVAGIVYGDVQMVSVYRSPKGDFQYYMNKLRLLLDRLDFSKGVVVSGDFNVHFENKCMEATLLTNLFESYGLTKTVSSPTRNDACLDNIFVNMDRGTLCVAETVDPCISDHLAISLSWEHKSHVSGSKQRIVYRPITELGLLTLYNSVEDVNWQFIDDQNMSCDKRFEEFIYTVVRACEFSFPVKTRMVDRATEGTYELNWFNSELGGMRDWLHFFTRLHRTDPNLISHDYLKSFRSDYRRRLQQAKRTSNDNYIKRVGNKNRAVWDIIKRHNPVRKCAQSEILTASAFSDYFTGIAESVISKVPHVGKDPLDYLVAMGIGRRGVQFAFEETSYNTVRDIISNLRNTPSKDAYDLNVRVVKTVKHLIVIPLTKLINLCIKSNIFPDCLKIAKVVPVLKKGSCDEANNYRPISVVPVFAKVYEHVLKGQMLAYLDQSSLLDPCQFGFRCNLSTTLAVNCLTDFIQDCFENKQFAMAFFFDLTKAFDCISHTLLTEKLRFYNFHENGISLLSSYLGGRKQYVNYRGLNSEVQPVLHGVPQGSVLGPLIFLIYINDICKCVDSDERLILFADDTTAVKSASDLGFLLRGCDSVQMKIHQWFHSNKLSINEVKTQQLCFSLRPNNLFVKPVAFLGVCMDSKLTWEAHALALCGKLSRNMYVLRSLKNVVSDSILLTTYYGYIQSHLSYAILCWGHSPHAQKVFAVQRKCIRLLSNIKYDQCCRGAFIELKVLTLPSIYVLNCLIYVRKNINKYPIVSDRHDHDTRNKNNIAIDYCRTYHARDGSNYFGLKLFNILPPSIRELGITLFKKRIGTYLKQRAFYSIQECLASGFEGLR